MGQIQGELPQPTEQAQARCVSEKDGLKANLPQGILKLGDPIADGLGPAQWGGQGCNLLGKFGPDT